MKITDETGYTVELDGQPLKDLQFIADHAGITLEQAFSKAVKNFCFDCLVQQRRNLPKVRRSSFNKRGVPTPPLH